MQQNIYEDIIPDILYFVNRKCKPGWSIIESRIDFHDLTYVYKGSSTYVVNGTEYKLAKGDFIYIPSGNVRAAYTNPDDPMHCFAANFRLSNLSGESGITLPIGPVLRTGVCADLMRLYGELDYVWVEKSYNHIMRARALFMLILDRILGRIASGTPAQQEDERLVRVKQYILHNFMNKIEMSQLAELAGLNPVYLGAFFKKANGCTIKQYITRIRINNAESLLSTGGYSVSEAAARSGFDDLFYFSKVFRAYKGYAPSVLLRGRNGL